MGSGGWLWFYSEDEALVNDIAKLHKLDRKVVEKYYKQMLESIKNDTKSQESYK